MKRGNFDHQLRLWKQLLPQLNLTSRMALREALGVEGIDLVELQLLREAAKSKEDV